MNKRHLMFVCKLKISYFEGIVLIFFYFLSASQRANGCFKSENYWNSKENHRLVYKHNETNNKARHTSSQIYEQTAFSRGSKSQVKRNLVTVKECPLWNTHSARSGTLQTEYFSIPLFRLEALRTFPTRNYIYIERDGSPYGVKSNLGKMPNWTRNDF